MANEILAKLLAMSDIWEKLIVLLIGWLMGLLAPAIVDGIKRKRENKLGREAILAELHDLSGVLATVTYLVRIREGTLDREFFIWLKGIYVGKAHGRVHELEQTHRNSARVVG